MDNVLSHHAFHAHHFNMKVLLLLWQFSLFIIVSEHHKLYIA